MPYCGPVFFAHFPLGFYLTSCSPSCRVRAAVLYNDMAGRRVKKDAMKRGEKRGHYKSAGKAACLDVIKECVEKGMASRDIKKAHPYITIPDRTLREYVKKMKAGESVTMGRRAGGGRKSKDPSLKGRRPGKQ